MTPNKQLQRTVRRHRGRAASASFHDVLAARSMRQRAAAELRRYAAELECMRWLRTNYQRYRMRLDSSNEHVVHPPTFAFHAHLDPRILEGFYPCPAGKLRALVGVEDFRSSSRSHKGFAQGGQTERAIKRVRQCLRILIWRSISNGRSEGLVDNVFLFHGGQVVVDRLVDGLLERRTARGVGE